MINRFFHRTGRHLLRGVLLTLPMAAFAAEDVSSYLDHPRAQLVRDTLAEQGADMARVDQLLQDAVKQPDILESIARPAERTLTWASYQDIFLQPERVRDAVAFAQQHQDTLQRAEHTYGVPASVILAIIAVETRFGQHMGNHRVLDALATLGFDYPPRADFFRRQLIALLQLDQLEHIDASEIKGSYAGAMGYGQFIPTSYQAYAVDFSGDGVVDKVNNVADAIGSVANYLAEHRWQPGIPLAARATVDGERYSAVLENGVRPHMTLAQAAEHGISPVRCDSPPATPFCFGAVEPDRVAGLLLEGKHGKEIWLVSQNFYAITRYNHSPLYAMAVTQLAQFIAAAMDASTPTERP